MLDDSKSLLERKIADNQRIRIAGKKFHIPKSIPTSILTFILSLILLPIVLSLTFIIINYFSQLVIWYLRDTSSNIIYYMIIGTIISWIICLIHMIFKKGEVIESFIDCLKTMTILTFTFIYIISLIFEIIDSGFKFTFESLFTFLINSILAIFTTLGWTIASTIIGLIVVIALSFIMRGIFKRLILYVELYKARKSRCYKALCYLIKDYDFDQTKTLDYIFITNDHINVIDDDEENQEIIFKDHNLPELTQYGIAAMACLIKLKNPYFRIKSDILGLTLINTNLETSLIDERTVEIKLEEVAKLSKEIKKSKKKKIKSSKDNKKNKQSNIKKNKQAKNK